MPSVAIRHGAVSVPCDEFAGALHLIVARDIAPGTRAQLGRMDAAQNAQFLLALR